MTIPVGYTTDFPNRSSSTLNYSRKQVVPCDTCSVEVRIRIKFTKAGEPDLWVCGKCLGSYLEDQDARTR